MELIKKYENFIKKDYKYGCIFLDLDISNWNNIIEKIDSDDLYNKKDPKYGIQKRPHITILWGINSEVKDSDVSNIINKYKYEQFDIKLSNIDIFRNDNFDVLKFSVDNNDTLIKFNNELSNLPNSNEFDYQPHITICYLENGKGDKYLSENFKINSLEVKSITYSNPKGQELKFDIYNQI